MALVRMDAFANYEAAAAVEFYAGSGAGAYSSSSVSGANTRRYHALLAAPLERPAGVFIFLSGLEEMLLVGSARHYISTHEYPGAVFPEGWRHLESFEMDPLPTFVYEVQGARIRKRIAAVPGSPTVVVSYELLGGPSDTGIEVRPLAAFRDRHQLTGINRSAANAARREEGWIILQPYEALPALRLRCGCEWTDSANWYHQMQYRRDRERGHAYVEDLMTPGYFSARLERGRPLYLTATIEPGAPSATDLLIETAAAGEEWLAHAESLGPFARKLAIGLRDFLVHTASGATLLRGVLWHDDWSRHAMLASAGLPLLGRFADMEAVLATWASRAQDGLLPLYVDSAGAARSLDLEGSLLFFEAVEQYLGFTGNYDWVRDTLHRFMGACAETILAGRSPAAHIGDDRLIYSPAEDRMLGPRPGWHALTEIQALFYNALRCMEKISAHYREDDEARRWSAAAKAVQKAFNERMWDSARHVPVDSIGEATDIATRPMCLWSIALSHPILIRRRWEVLLDQVENALLTPYGLLGLPPEYPGSRKIFSGDSFEDARRRGGIWPEFLGPFLFAHARTFGRGETRMGRTLDYLAPLEASLSKDTLLHLPEFFDAVDPFTPRGAPSNAAASGQILRALACEVEPRHFGGEGEP